MEGQPRAEVVLQRGDEVIATWALVCTGTPDLGVVDELARLHLAARRLGYTMWLRDACPDLLQLLVFVGLRDVVARRPGGLQAVGQPEGGEEAGVEEVVMPDDPVT